MQLNEKIKSTLKNLGKVRWLDICIMNTKKDFEDILAAWLNVDMRVWPDIKSDDINIEDIRFDHERTRHITLYIRKDNEIVWIATYLIIPRCVHSKKKYLVKKDWKIKIEDHITTIKDDPDFIIVPGWANIKKWERWKITRWAYEASKVVLDIIISNAPPKTAIEICAQWKNPWWEKGNKIPSESQIIWKEINIWEFKMDESIFWLPNDGSRATCTFAEANWFSMLDWVADIDTLWPVYYKKLENGDELIKWEVIKMITDPCIPDMKKLFSKPYINTISWILNDLSAQILGKLSSLDPAKISIEDFEFLVWESKFDRLYSMIVYYSLTYARLFRWDEILNLCNNIEELDSKHASGVSKHYWTILEVANKLKEQNFGLSKEQNCILDKLIERIELSKSNRIENKLTRLSLQFEYNLNKFEDGNLLNFEDKKWMDGLTEDALNRAESLAKNANLSWYAFKTQNLRSLSSWITDPNKRNQIFEFLMSQIPENKSVTLKMLKLRKKDANEKWYEDFLELKQKKCLLDTKEKVNAFTDEIWKSLLKRLEEWENLLKRYFWLESKLSYSDFVYYSLKYKHESEIITNIKFKNCFEFKNVLEYLKKIAKETFWLDMKISEHKPYDECICYEIYREWKMLGYHVIDFLTRKWKSPWNYNVNLRYGYKEAGNYIPIINITVINANDIRSWKVFLWLKWARSLFHEFWHALHSMLNESVYLKSTHPVWLELDTKEMISVFFERFVTSRQWISELSLQLDTGNQLSDKDLDEFEKVIRLWDLLDTSLIFERVIIDRVVRWVKQINEENIQNSITTSLREKSYFDISEISKDFYTRFDNIFYMPYEGIFYSYILWEVIAIELENSLKWMPIFDRQKWEILIRNIFSKWSMTSTREILKQLTWSYELKTDSYIKEKETILNLIKSNNYEKYIRRKLK